ncbi:hypothetical protein AB7W86_23210, partial [Providencia rettgeri]
QIIIYRLWSMKTPSEKCPNFVVQNKVLNGRKRETCPPSEELPDFVKYRLDRAGLTPHHVGVNKMDNLIVKKADQPTQKGHRIHIPAWGRLRKRKIKHAKPVAAVAMA